MGNLNEFSMAVRTFLRVYPWRRIDPAPWKELAKPLNECRLALISTAGLVAPGQDPFDETVRGGDVSFREIPSDIEMGELIERHRSESFDHAGLQEDPNLGLPIERGRELAEQGRIGSLNRRHLSFMGSITAPGRLMRQTAPAAARLLADDAVDAALLVPV
jgi:D-proline reductase (dithiol) PrdB